ncbi:MAG TPA: hypothetical protein VM166_11100 [Gemmatimonadaceae bacterium]|nr:hypothetical protein [Gemmatimonadaceae bacterium]
MPGLFASIAGGQQPIVATTAPIPAATAKVIHSPALFQSEEPLEVTFTTNIDRIRHDKSADAPWRPATLTYKASDGNLLSVPLRARTRGIWRLRECDFPPLRLNFSGESSKGTVFHHLDKPKLVSYCKNSDSHEQYVLQEFQLYRIYHLLTPVSHKARLLKFAYADSATGKIRAHRYGFIMEEGSALGARLGGKVLDQKGALPGDLDAFQDALFGVFQYFVGNTDFSESELHNVELLFNPDGVVMPIAYDFDFAGAVNATYATPPPMLNLPNVRQRLFRGYCVDRESYARVFALFNDKKTQIYGLYSDPIGKLLDARTAKETLRYFDSFYETINNSRLAKGEITGSCIKRP